MAEIFYNHGKHIELAAFEELTELHDIIERGPDWNGIEKIEIRLNRSSVIPETSGIRT